MSDVPIHPEGVASGKRVSRTLLAVALAGLAAFVVLRGQLTPLSEWPADFQQAQRNAVDAQKPLLIQFSSSGCPYCVRMDREVLTTEAVGALLADFELVRIDAWQEDALAGRYGIEGIPAFVVLGPQGQFVGKVEGYQPADRFTAFLRRAAGALSRVSVR
ncbi:MAG: thioredoxin family protein [Phycisphaerae bacterium]